MAAGDPLSKTTTYKDVIDLVKLRVKLDGDPYLRDTLLIKEISLAISKWASILCDASAPFYYITKTIQNSITGTANPYIVDLSAIDPFIWRIAKVIHITDGGTRTNVVPKDLMTAENDQQLSNMNATSLWYSNEGDTLKFYKGSSFTITIASDDVEISYYRQAKVIGVTRTSYVDIIDAYVPVIVSEVTSTLKQYKGIDNTKEVEYLNNMQTSIMNSFKQAA